MRAGRTATRRAPASSTAARRQSGGRKPPRLRKPSKRSRRSARKRAGKRGILGRLGRGGVIAVALVLAAGIYGVSRIDFGETIRELTLPLQHDNIIRQQAADKNVPPDLIAAVINAESGFRPRTSEAGARGLMQIRPDTARDIERRSGGETFVVEDLADPDLNIRYGTFHLRELLDLYDDNVVAALAAYNAGPAHASAWGGSELEVEDIRFPETRAYVERVLEFRRSYRRSYSAELGL